jgi:hypothetical protein
MQSGVAQFEVISRHAESGNTVVQSAESSRPSLPSQEVEYVPWKRGHMGTGHNLSHVLLYDMMPHINHIHSHININAACIGLRANGATIYFTYRLVLV